MSENISREKHYETVATAFRLELQNLDRLLQFRAGRTGGISSYNEGQIQELRTLITIMAFWLGQNDPEFDRDKFFTDCGVVSK